MKNNKHKSFISQNAYKQILLRNKKIPECLKIENVTQADVCILELL